MKTFKQFITEAAKKKREIFDNSIFVVTPEKELKVAHPEGYPRRMEGNSFIEHNDHFPGYNYWMSDQDTEKYGTGHMPRPLSFGRIDHKSKQFYIISQARGQPKDKETFGNPNYTLMHRRDVEKDVFDRLHTAKAIHEQFPGYRVEVSGEPHVVLTLPEYEKYLMSHLKEE